MTRTIVSTGGGGTDGRGGVLFRIEGKRENTKRRKSLARKK